MNSEIPKTEAEFESTAEPLQRLDFEFQIGPAWRHLMDAPVVDFERCDNVPIKAIHLSWPPGGACGEHLRVVRLADDVASAFADEAAVNHALREYLRTRPSQGEMAPVKAD